MGEWLLRALLKWLLVMLLLAIGGRLVYELLRPVVPALIGAVVMILILLLVWRRFTGW